MRFIIDPKIFKDFPGLVIGVVVAKNSNNKEINPEINKLFVEQQDKIKSLLTIDLLKEDARITAWHDAYRKFKSKPNEYRCSIENLCRLLLKGKELRISSPLVNLYNYVSLKYLLPVGGEDIDAIQGNILLTYAGKDENPVVLLGDPKEERPYPGEVFYKDAKTAVCRRWNWREADRTKITDETNNAFFVIEALPPTKSDEVSRAVNELKELIERFCGGSVETAILDAHHSSVEIINDGTDDHVFQESEMLPELMEGDSSSQEHTVRIEKVLTLVQKNIEAWPPSMPIEGNSKQVFEEYALNEGKEYTLAGRLMTIRLHGKTAFAHLQDAQGRIQIYIRKDEVGDDNFSLFENFIDIGDIVRVKGISFITKMGEITLKVCEFTLLSKCLYPLPEKFHGLTDTEKRYRQRYLDLITNQETRTKFIKRSVLVRSLRSYLDDNGFMEVETPMLHPIPGGAAARPFITHHNAFNSDFYLRIAPELYLKRLVIGGFDRVYEVNRNFRNEGVSTRHNPEFTMVEFYMAYHDYIFIMDFVEKMIKKMVAAADNSLKVSFGNHVLDFEKPFATLSVKNSVMQYGNYTHEDLSLEAIDKTLNKEGIYVENKLASLGQKIFLLFEKIVEPQLIQPTYITEFPIEISPLAKRDVNNPEYAARFELFIGGMEIANGFNELNDPFDQAQRFKQQVKEHEAGDSEAHHYDADYIQALEYGLPPCVGVGIGIDRLVMLATNTISIKDVILFPTLKKK